MRLIFIVHEMYKILLLLQNRRRPHTTFNTNYAMPRVLTHSTLRPSISTFLFWGRIPYFATSIDCYLEVHPIVYRPSIPLDWTWDIGLDMDKMV